MSKSYNISIMRLLSYSHLQLGFLILFLAAASSLHAFLPNNHITRSSSQQEQQQYLQRSKVLQTPSFVIPSSWIWSNTVLSAQDNDEDDDDDDFAPQVFASGYSTNPDLAEALQEAVQMAVQALPSSKKKIDLCLCFISSLYDGGTVQPASTVIPTILETAENLYGPIQHLLGSSVAGCISSHVVLNNMDQNVLDSSKRDDSSSQSQQQQTTQTVEMEGIPAVSVTLALLPGVPEMRTFDCGPNDVPDDIGRLPLSDWQRPLGLSGFASDSSGDVSDNASASASASSTSSPVFMLLPSPAFSTSLDELLQGISTYYPNAQTMGGIASTVSSLSRARLYRYSHNQGGNGICITTDACVGLAMQGDIAVQTLVAQGAKPVGGIYQILQGQDSSIQVIVLDETATEALNLEEEEEEEAEEDDDDEDEDSEQEEESAEQKREKMVQVYAKARIPKPILAEANFLMRTLSDDDQAFMRRQLLVGLEQGGSVGRSASELARLAKGEGHRFRVHQVASAGMKDGSVTFPLGSVEINPGTRMRFFVRESNFAKKEVEALWLGYKKRLLNAQFGTTTSSDNDDDDSEGSSTSSSAALSASFTPSGCMVIPTLDRGSKFFLGKPGFESGAAARLLPGVPSIAGFFSNGVIGRMEEEGPSSSQPLEVQGSASGYFLIGSKSGRPVFSAAVEAAQQAAKKQEQAAEKEAARVAAAEDEKRRLRAAAKGSQDLEQKAPRSEDGELIFKRREVHSGRALTVSTVEWSVAEKTATPSSMLEGFMWDKETEVDRFRERQPLANLVSQCRLASSDPTKPKPRDFIGPIKQAAEKGFVIIPECKRMEPSTGSLRKRYDISKLARDFTLVGAPAISINCDAVLFGGSPDDISTARQAASAAAVEQMSEDGVVVPPILASDLLLYPYQLYKLSLAGADAVNLLVGALASKDLMYLTKIAASLKLQKLATATSEVQLEALASLPAGSIDAVILSNRELEDFSIDETGNQVVSLLKSEALQNVRQKHGDDLPVLVEGSVGLIEWPDQAGGKSTDAYLEEIQKLGALGAIVGRGLVVDGMESSDVLVEMQGANL